MLVWAKRAMGMFRALGAIPGDAIRAVMEFEKALAMMPRSRAPELRYAERFELVFKVLQSYRLLPRKDLTFLTFEIVEALAEHDAKWAKP